MRVNMHEAKSNLSALVAKAKAGERVEIGPAGGDAVALVPVRKRRFPWGCLKHLGPLNPEWNSKETNAEIAKLFNGE